MKLWKLLCERLLLCRDKTFAENNTIFSYHEIFLKVEQLSKELTQSCYGIYCDSELHSAIALLACIAADTIAVPLSKRYGDIHCQRIIDQSGLQYVITDKGEDGAFFIKQVSNHAFQMPEGKKPQLIMYTSGTTGHPKGAMISQDNLLCNLNDIEKYFAIHHSDRILISRPLYHGGVLTGEFLISIMKGLDIVFYSGMFNPYALCSIINEQRITVMGGTPTLFYHMASMEKRLSKCRSLRIIVTSGECLMPAVASRISSVFSNASIYNVYGLTEASPRVAYLPPNMFSAHCSSVGYPLNSLQIRIVLETGEIADPEMEGELLVKGESVMLGYYGDPEMTNRKIRDGWLYTGDIAVLSSDGLLSIKCRKDDLIIKAGMNIYPQEIENAVKLCLGVREVCAYAKNDPIRGVLICVLVEVNGLTIDNIAEHCRKNLPIYEAPDEIIIVDSIPRNGSGKINRSAVITLTKTM